MKEPSKEQIKERAKHLRQLLLEKHKIDLPHGHSLEVLAKVFGYKDWNTASAQTSKVSAEKPVAIQKINDEKPIAAKFQTVGDMMEFLSTFDKTTKLVVNEYQWSELDPENFGTITSVCSLTYDNEIQNGDELRLELNTETERNDHTIGKGASQNFDRTKAGRLQRRIKYLYMQNSFWNPTKAARSF